MEPSCWSALSSAKTKGLQIISSAPFFTWREAMTPRPFPARESECAGVKSERSIVEVRSYRRRIRVPGMLATWIGPQ